jgi:hypothetical protein
MEGVSMAREWTVIGHILTIEHETTSRMGNPTYRVTLTDGQWWLTETNGSIGYGATNYRPRHHWGDDDLAREAVVLHLRTVRGQDRIWHITREDGRP